VFLSGPRLCPTVYVGGLDRQLGFRADSYQQFKLWVCPALSVGCWQAYQSRVCSSCKEKTPGFVVVSSSPFRSCFSTVVVSRTTNNTDTIYIAMNV